MPLPPPPRSSFASDNTAPVAPEVLEALAAANTPAALPYGDDAWTERMAARFCEVFDAPVEVLPCWGGTGANVVGLATMLRPWQAVICADSAHVAVDECGAPTRFTQSALVPVPTADGKLTPESLEVARGWAGDVHHAQPGVVSVSQSTELGTVYTADELGALVDAAHALGMRAHVDGARIANAVAATGTTLAEMARDSGVDVMTFGATKNGAMFGDAVVLLDSSLAAQAPFVRKQAGQLPSKARFVAAQFLALLEDDLWLRHARHANEMAALLAEQAGRLPGVRLAREPAANAVFAYLPPEVVETLQAWSFFWVWEASTSLVRWMTSFATTARDVECFAAGVAAALAAHGYR